MKIAITGAGGTVGQEVVKLCAEKGYKTVQIELKDQKNMESTSMTEYKTADVAASYKDVLAAFKGCDAVIHLAAIPDPVDKEDSVVHANNVNSAFGRFSTQIPRLQNLSTL